MKIGREVIRTARCMKAKPLLQNQTSEPNIKVE